MPNVLDETKALHTQLSYLKGTRDIALATFLTGKTRREFRTRLEETLAWDAYARMCPERCFSPPLTPAEYWMTVHAHDRAVDVDERIEAESYGACANGGYEEFEEQLGTYEQGQQAHLAYALLYLSRMKLLSCFPDPKLVCEIAMQFARSEEGNDFLAEQASVFAAKTEWHPPENEDIHNMRESAVEEIRTVLGIITRTFPPGWEESPDGA